MLVAQTRHAKMANIVFASGVVCEIGLRLIPRDVLRLLVDGSATMQVYASIAPLIALHRVKRW